MRYRIKNWEEFQHYKKRRPPWIKLHRSTLDDYAFCRLPDASRAIAPCIWLLASESDDGSVPADPNELAFRLHQSVKWITDSVKPLIDNGFLVCLQDASAMIAECKQEILSETETEKSTETEERQRHPALQEVLDYAKQRGAAPQLARKFFDYYTTGNWVDAKGKRVRNWKQKFITWETHTEPKQDNFTGSSTPDRPCQQCGGPWPCKKCYPEEVEHE